jgi:hypothetical protein
MKVLRHWHVVCWSCGGDVISDSARTYHCPLCDCIQNYMNPKYWTEFVYIGYDPDFAAGNSSPA